MKAHNATQRKIAGAYQNTTQKHSGSRFSALFQYENEEIFGMNNEAETSNRSNSNVNFQFGGGTMKNKEINNMVNHKQTNNSNRKNGEKLVTVGPLFHQGSGNTISTKQSKEGRAKVRKIMKAASEGSEMVTFTNTELLQIAKGPESTHPNAVKSINGKRLHSSQPDNNVLHADMVENSFKDNPPDEDNIQSSDKMEMQTESKQVEILEAQISKGRLVILN